MLPGIKQFRIEATDWLRYNPLVRRGVGFYRLLWDSSKQRNDSQAAARAIVKLCSVARLSPDEQTLQQVEHRIQQRLRNLDVAQVDWTEFVPAIDRPHIGKAVVIKPWVSDREKGVIFISFEDQWAKLLAHGDLREFARRYTLVVSPTWSPAHCLVNYLFPLAFPGPIFSLISNHQDLEIIPRFAPSYVMVPLFASSWVNPAYYQPVPRENRDVDIVMVANFGRYKRHHALFRAMKQMPAHIRATLVGQSQDGRTADTIRHEARCYGVGDRVTVLGHVSNETVSDSLGRAKVSVILSRREGSCVVVAESLFADTPTVLLEGAAIGSAAFINSETGRFVPERDLAAGLMEVISNPQAYAPRRWAEANISCHHSSRILNDVLKQHLQLGQEWTRDIAPFCWRPDPQLVRPEDQAWMRNECEQIRARFGIEVGPGNNLR